MSKYYLVADYGYAGVVVTECENMELVERMFKYYKDEKSERPFFLRIIKGEMLKLKYRKKQKVINWEHPVEIIMGD